MPSKIILISLQTSKILLFNIQIMKVAWWNFFFIKETEQTKLRLECSVLPEPTVHIWNKLNSALWPKMGHISRLWLITTEDSPIINVLKNNRDLWKLEQD